MANKRNSSRTSSPVLRRSTQEYLRCLLLRWLGDTGKRQGTHRFMRQWYNPLRLASHLISHARRWGGFYDSGIECYNRAKKPRISQLPDYYCCRPRNPLINQLFSKLKRPDSPKAVLWGIVGKLQDRGTVCYVFVTLCQWPSQKAAPISHAGKGLRQLNKNGLLIDVLVAVCRFNQPAKQIGWPRLLGLPTRPQQL